MEDFDKKVIESIKAKIVKEINTADFVKLEYGDRQKLPTDFINKAWANVDWSIVLENVRNKMEIKICNAIVGNMEAEIKTDVKKLMAVDGVREKLRIEIYPRLMEIFSREK